MKVFFIKATHSSSSILPIQMLDMSFNWQRPLSVLLAIMVTAFLHGLLLFWYFNRPAPPEITGAAPLPVIDIALTAPKAGTVAQTVAQPLPTKPEIKPLDKKVKPKETIKPKPISKPKPKSEIKKPLTKPNEKPVEASSASALPTSLNQTTQAAPEATAPTTATKQSSPRSEETQASANASYLNNPSPPYPPIAEQRHWEGTVVLKVYVTTEGRCGDIKIARSSGHDAIDESALTTVKNWRFEPAKRAGIPFAQWVELPVEFKLPN